MLNNMAKEGEKSTLPKIEGTSEMNHHIKHNSGAKQDRNANVNALEQTTQNYCRNIEPLHLRCAWFRFYQQN